MFRAGWGRPQDVDRESRVASRDWEQVVRRTTRKM